MPKVTASVFSEGTQDFPEFSVVLHAHFPTDWDEFYYQTYFYEKNKKNLEQKLFSDLALTMAGKAVRAYMRKAKNQPDIEPEEERKSELSTRNGATSSHHQLANTNIEIHCYIHRVGVDRRGPFDVYSLLLYDPENTEVFTTKIKQTQMYSYSKYPGIMSTICYHSEVSSGGRLSWVYGTVSESLHSQLYALSLRLKQEIDGWEDLSFLNYRKKHRNLLIAERIHYPDQIAFKISVDDLYQKVLGVNYLVFFKCLNYIKEALPYYDNVDEYFAQERSITMQEFRHYEKMKQDLTAAKTYMEIMVWVLGNINNERNKEAGSLYLLKKRFEWIVLESARKYYLEIFYDSKDNKKSVIHEFNKRFYLLADLNQLFRLKFKKTDYFSLEKFIEHYNALVKASSGVIWHTKLHEILINNMKIVYEDYNRLRWFDFSEGGYVLLNPACSKLLAITDVNKINLFFSNDLQKIEENRKKLNNIINIPQTYKITNVSRFLKQVFQQESDKRAYLSHLLMYVEPSLRPSSLSPQEETEEAKETEAKESVPRAVIDSLRQPLLSTAASDQSVLQQDQKTIDIEDIKPQPQQTRQTELLSYIDQILSCRHWWMRQLRGCCSGEMSGGLVVQTGVARMLAIKDKPYEYMKSFGIEALHVLQQYQAIARQRLYGWTWSSLFALRPEATTQRFYQMLDALDVYYLTPDDVENFKNFAMTIEADRLPSDFSTPATPASSSLTASSRSL